MNAQHTERCNIGGRIMILAVDIGNSNIVFGCIDEQKIYFVARMATDRSRMADPVSYTHLTSNFSAR